MSQISTEIVVPVHDRTRPVRRAVESLLKDAETRAIVIAHNIDPDALDLPGSDRVRVLPLEGAEGMPGATFDAGIAAATAPWVGIMGSDDWYQDGALAAMRRRAKHDDADGVIAPLTHQFLEFNQIKPLTHRRSGLDPVRDRMFYRTAPLGIYRTEIMQRPEYRFGDVFPAGSDMRVTALLWTAGFRFSYYWDDPAYVVGKDAQSRVTFTPRPLQATGAPYRALLEEPLVADFDRATRQALAVKMARVHILGAVTLRPTEDLWQPGDLAWLRAYAQDLRHFAPGVYRGLSRRDQRIISAVLRADLPEILIAQAQWKSSPLLSRALPANPLMAVIERDSTLHWALAAAGARLAAGKRPF